MLASRHNCKECRLKRENKTFVCYKKDLKVQCEVSTKSGKSVNTVHQSQLSYPQDNVGESFSLLTQEGNRLQHGTDLIHRTQGLAAFMVVAAKTVDPPQEPAFVSFGFSVKFLQQLGGHRKVILETTFVDEFVVQK